MSNLPMIPGVPSNAEVDAMKRAMQAIHGNVPSVHEQQASYSGGHQGTRRQINETVAAPAYMPSFGTSAEEVQQMKDLMEKLDRINGGSETMLTETAPAQLPNGGQYEVIAILAESEDAPKNFSVVVSGTRQSAITGICLQEAAQAVAKYLNRGQTLESAKVQQVLDLEEDYNQSKVEARTIKERYNRAVKLGENEAAGVFKKRHAVVRANALSTQDQIKSILASIR